MLLLIGENMKTCVLFGHRRFVHLKENELYSALIELVNGGVHIFYVGTHGDFDRLAYSVLVRIKKEFDIKIFLVFTSSQIFKKTGCGTTVNNIYSSAECISFAVEHLHYKRRILESNKLMVDKSDIVLCYVDMNNTTSGARKAVLYAQKKNLPIINLFK